MQKVRQNIRMVSSQIQTIIPSKVDHIPISIKKQLKLVDAIAEYKELFEILAKNREERSQIENQELFSQLLHLKQVRKIIKYNQDQIETIKTYLVNNVELKVVRKGNILISEDVRNHNQYIVLEGNALYLELIPTQMLKMEIEQFMNMQQELQTIQGKRNSLKICSSILQLIGRTRRKPNSQVHDIKDLEKQKYQKSMIRRLSKSFGVGFQININNITNIDSIGSLKVSDIQQKNHMRLFQQGVFRYTIVKNIEHQVFFKQSNRNSKVISETDCVFLVFNDQGKKLLGWIDNIWNSKVKNIMNAIDSCFGFQSDGMKDKKRLVFQNLKKKKYLKNEVIYQQNEQLEHIYIIDKGEVKLLQQSVQSNDKKPISKMKQITKYKEHEVSLLSNQQFINQEIIFQERSNFSAKVVSQKCSVYYIEKKVLMVILDHGCDDFLQSVCNQQLNKDQFYSDMIKLKSLNAINDNHNISRHNVDSNVNNSSNINRISKNISNNKFEDDVGDVKDSRKAHSQYDQQDLLEKNFQMRIKSQRNSVDFQLIQQQVSKKNQYHNEFNKEQKNMKLTLQKKLALAILDKIDKNSKLISNYQKQEVRDGNEQIYNSNQKLGKNKEQVQEQNSKKSETYLKNLKYKPLDFLRMKAQYIYEKAESNNGQKQVQNHKIVGNNNIGQSEQTKITERYSSLDSDGEEYQNKKLSSLPKLNTVNSSYKFISSKQQQYDRVEKMNQEISQKQMKFKNSIQNRKLRRQYIRSQRIESNLID